MVCLVSKTGRLKNESLLTGMLLKSCGSIKSIVINTNSKSTNVILGHECRTLYGSPYITDRLLGLTFKLSPLSFYQVNRIQAEKLYKIAAGYAALSKDDTLADLYCGTGTIGLTMARYAKQVIGIEIVKDAIDDANGNARINGIENARFICSDSKNALEVFKNEGVSPDVIVIDPPRKGCSSELIAQITEISPRRIVYVSCDPATLARDLKVFSLSGYRVLEITPVDMFPRTAHVETVALVSK